MAGYRKRVLYVHSGDEVVYSRKWTDKRDCITQNQINEPHELICTHVVHFTENTFAQRIGLLNTDDPFCFQARQWLNTDFKLTWWSPVPPPNCRHILENNLPDLRSDIKKDIGNSHAFDGNSFCGPVGFVTPWKDMLKQYAVSRQGCVEDVECRILGTFIYKKELMYAVLVCLRGDTGAESYPLVGPDGTEAFQRMPSDEYFKWKVFSTVAFTLNRPLGLDWTWDHVSFGFNCPNGSLSLPPQLCGIRTKKSVRFVPLSRSEQRNRKLIETVASNEVVAALREKINRLRLFECYRLLRESSQM